MHLSESPTPDTVFLVSTLPLLFCLVDFCLLVISESYWLLRYSNVRFRIPRLHPALRGTGTCEGGEPLQDCLWPVAKELVDTLHACDLVTEAAHQ